ncbi:hypothetical protein FY046_20705 [Erwinia sp. 1181_3]|nr:hypothetical protein [Erwinia rhapontici]
MNKIKSGTLFALLNSILYTRWNSTYGFYHRVYVTGLAAPLSAASAGRTVHAGRPAGGSLHRR